LQQKGGIVDRSGTKERSKLSRKIATFSPLLLPQLLERSIYNQEKC